MPYRSLRDNKESIFIGLGFAAKKLVKIALDYEISVVYTNSFVSIWTDTGKIGFLDQKTLYSNYFKELFN